MTTTPPPGPARPTPRTPQDGRKLRTRYSPVLILDVYRLMRAGLKQEDVRLHLRVSKETFNQWQKRYPELRAAIRKAQTECQENDTFANWIYRRLPEDLQKLWDKIDAWDPDTTPVSRIEALLSDHGKRARQQLFLHALVTGNYSPSHAMHKTCVSKRQLDAWVRDDPEFAELFSEIQWHKGNWFEESLCRLVSEGNPAAVIFANKTYNASRGYAPRSQLDINHTGSVAVGVLDLSELLPYLADDHRLALLEAIRQKEAQDARVLTAPTPGPEERVAQEISALAE